MWLYVIRHGDSFFNAAGRAEGHLDSGLTRAGVEHAFAVADRLAREPHPPRRIFSSDLPRARYTAALLAEGLGLGLEAVETSRMLREVDYGRLAGTPFDDLDPLYLQDMDAFFPGGESRGAMRQRVLYHLRHRILRADGDGGEGSVLLVAHGGSHRVLLAEYGGEDFRALYGGPLPKHVHRFEITDGAARSHACL